VGQVRWKMYTILPETKMDSVLRHGVDCAHGAQTSAKMSNLNRNSNPDFLINPDSDPYVCRCRIAAKMLCIDSYLVGVSHFAECRGW